MLYARKVFAFGNGNHLHSENSNVSLDFITGGVNAVEKRTIACQLGIWKSPITFIG